MKKVRIRSFSGPYFSAFGLNTDQKNSEYGHFSRNIPDQKFRKVLLLPSTLKFSYLVLWKTRILGKPVFLWDITVFIVLVFLTWSERTQLTFTCLKSTAATLKLCSKLTIKTAKRRQWLHSVAFIVNFEYITHFFLVFLLLTLNK